MAARARALYRQSLRTVQRLPMEKHVKEQHRQSVKTIFRVYKLETNQKKIEKILQRGNACNDHLKILNAIARKVF